MDNYIRKEFLFLEASFLVLGNFLILGKNAC